MNFKLVYSVLALNLVNEVFSQTAEIQKLFQTCKKYTSEFDRCIKNSFNDLRPFFKTGLPEFNVAPFDPHMSPYVALRRGDPSGFGGFTLLLFNVSEFGWTNSEVTKYRTDYDNDRIVYTQYFPEKSLNGLYDFQGSILGKPSHTKGNWSMTLFKYAQTTSVQRIGGKGGYLKVRVEIDKLGDLQMHISDLFGGKKIIESFADFLINTAWQPGFPFVKPIINELVSTAFTDIFNESFRNFPLDLFIRD